MNNARIENYGRITAVSVALPAPGDTIRQLFTAMRGGASGTALDFDHRKGDNPAVRASYEAAAAWFGVSVSSVFVMRQVHGGDIAVIREFPAPSLMYAAVAADGAVTNCAGLVLTVLTADCLPILLADRRRRVIAAAHAGWRSSAACIAEKAVTTMRAVFGSDPGDITAALGPAIGRCCFEVGAEVLAAVRESFDFADACIDMKAGGKGMLDLIGLNRGVLIRAGVDADSIRSADLCTYCRDDLFYSYRRQQEGTGRMLAGIMIEG